MTQYRSQLLRIPSACALLVAMLVTRLPCHAQLPGGDDTMLSEARTAVGDRYGSRDALAEQGVAPAKFDAGAAPAEPLDASNGDLKPAASTPAKLLPPRTNSSKPSTDGASATGSKSTARYPSVTTLVGSTCVVLSLFFAVAWLLKRAAPRAMRNLSPAAIEVLGRVPLARGQHVQLVRCGSRVLLVAISGTACQTLTEITDPQEVDSLLAACGTKGAPQPLPEAPQHAAREGYSAQPDRVKDLLQSVTGAGSREARYA